MKPPGLFSDFGSDPTRQILLPALVVIPLALALLIGGPTVMAALAIFVIAGGVFLANPRAFILAFLTLISLRNFVAGGERIGTSSFDFDLGGLVNILTTTMGVVYFLVLWKNPFKGRSLTWPYGIFLGIFALEMQQAPDFRWAVRFVTRLAAPFFTYLVISDLIDRKMVRQVIWALYASSVIPIVYGFYQWGTGGGNAVTEGYMRINSSFFHPAHFSMYLVFLFCLAYSELLIERYKNTFLLVGYLGCIVLLEILTYTRVSWFAMAICFVYLTIIYKKPRYLVAAALLGGILMIPFGDKILGRFTDISNAIDPSAMDEGFNLNTSGGWRLFFWNEISRRIWDSPWFGFGAGSSVMLGVELFGVEAAPHNGFLRVLYETGFIGLASFFYMLLAMLWQGLRLLRTQKDTRVTFLSHVYITMTLTYIILNLSDNILEYYEVAIYQWAILSLVEFTNLRAAKAGLIAQERFEEGVEVEREEVEEIRRAAAGDIDDSDSDGNDAAPVVFTAPAPAEATGSPAPPPRIPTIPRAPRRPPGEEER